MRPLFPTALTDALKPEDPKGLARALDALQREFTVARTQRRGGYLRHRAAVEAYGHFYGLRTALKTSVLLKELRPQATRILDLGAGTLGASLGAVHALESIDTVIAFDRSKQALEWGAEQVTRFRPTVTVKTQAWDALKTAKPFPQADVAIIANLLNEFNNPKRAESLVRAACRAVGPTGLVLIIEPGTRAASLQLIGLRENAKTRRPIAGPCFGAPTCPYAQNPRSGWCFSELRGTEPDWYASLREQAGIRQARLAYSWLAFGPNDRASEAFARVISGRMKVGHYLCTKEGRILANEVPKAPRRGAILDLSVLPRARRLKKPKR